MTPVQGWDITAANYDKRPRMGQAMLYMTGSPDIKATPAMIAANPWCVLTDQSPVIDDIDTTADVYDCEAGALTVAELPDVINAALINRVKRARHGQRTPLVYASADNLDEVTSSLRRGNVGYPGCGLHVAHWGIGPAAAIAMIGTHINGFAVRAVQYENAGTYDLDYFDVEWLATSGQWNHSWTSHGQQWTLIQLGDKLSISANDLNPGNGSAFIATMHPHTIIPVGAHFTYRKIILG